MFEDFHAGQLLRPASKPGRRLLFLLGALALAACTQKTVKLVGQPCLEGKCLSGFACHPESNACVYPVAVGCTDSTEYCPASLTTGGACPAVGSFVPCVNSVENCDKGCRTCGEDLTWSACTAGNCTLGTVTGCTSCADDCTVQIQHGTATCRTSPPPTRCDYTVCAAGYYNADGNRQNGCECARTNSGVEICDHLDNDCNGVVDNVSVPAKCQCSNSGASGTEICDGVDNNCDNSIDEGFACTAGQIRDCDAGTGAASGSESCASNNTCVWNGLCVKKDGVPPVQVSGFTAVPGDNQVALSWTYPNDLDLLQCVIMRDTTSTPTNHSVGTLVYDNAAAQALHGQAGNYMDASAVNGTQYFYAMFCRDASDNWQETVTSANSASATPFGRVVDFSAHDGESTQVTLTFTMPAGAANCKVIRAAGAAYPTNNTNGTSVGTASGTGAKSLIDTGRTNATDYYYAVYCESNGTYRDDVATAGENADTGTPIATATGFAASSGLDTTIALSFTMPPSTALAPASCKIVKCSGACAAGNMNDAALTTEFTGTGSKNYSDTGLTNGTTYYYAVFCRAETLFRNSTLNAGNSGSAVPIGRVMNFSASDGESGRSTLTFTMPTGAANCKVIKAPGAAYPTTNTDGTNVGSVSGSGAKTVTDNSCANGTDCYYAVFCNVDGTYRNNDKTAGENADTGSPIAVVSNFVATSGEDAKSTLTFTMPPSTTLAPATCKIVKCASACTTGNMNDAALTSFSTSGAKTYVDSPLTNGTVFYHYAVFCRSGTSFVNNTVGAGNSASNVLAIAPVNNFAAADGEVGQSTLTFTMPTGATACKIKRGSGAAYPADNTAGSLVGIEQTGSGSKTVADTGLAAATTYYYVVYCRVGTSYLNNARVDPPTGNSDTGTTANTVTISHRNLGCNALSANTNQTLIGVNVLAQGAASTLTSVTFRKHTASTTDPNTQFTAGSVKLYEDLGTAGWDAGDTQLGTGQSFSGNAVTFSGLTLALADGVAKPLILVADIGAGANNTYFAASMTSSADFSVSVSSKVLSPAPLNGNAHLISGLSCASLVSDGSGPIAAATSIAQASSATWYTQNDNTITCDAERCYPFTGQTNSPNDCNLDDNGDPERLSVSDQGNTSRILHINTGLPLGLPICGLTLRLFASDSRENAITCRTGNAANRLFGDNYGGVCSSGCLGLDTHYFYWYSSGTDTSGSVNSTGTGALTPTITNGPASANACYTQYVDHNLKTLYDAATSGGASTTNFHVRFVADSGNGLNTSATLTIQHLPEIYVRIQ